MNESVKSLLTFVGSLTLVSLCWEAAVAGGAVNSIVLPAPTEIIGALGYFVSNFTGRIAYWEDTWITFQEILGGFLLGTTFAVVIGTLVVEFTPMKRLIIPYMIALNSTPKIAFAPLFAIWFGFGAMPKVLMAAFICSFPVLMNTITGLRSVESDQLELMAVLRASRWQTFRRLKFKVALPYIFASLKTAMAFATIGAVIGEFAGAIDGLGFQLEFAAARLRTDRVFAFLIVLSVIAYALYLIVEILEKRVVFWTRLKSSDRQ
jgi:NitT/TauT family transport system permease protein